MDIRYIPHLPDTIPYRIAWLNNTEVNRYLGTSNTTLDEQRDWFVQYQRDSTRDFFTITDSDKPIGIVGLTNIDQEKGEVKIFIMIGDPEYRGRGIGKLAMQFIVKHAKDELGISNLSLEVHRDNAAAIRCYQAVGFLIEGEVDEEGEIIMKLS